MGRREPGSRGPAEASATEDVRDREDGGRRGNEEGGIAGDMAGVALAGTDEGAAEILRALEWGFQAVRELHRDRAGLPDLVIDSDMKPPQQRHADDLEAFLATLGHEQELFAIEVGRLETEVERVLAELRGRPLSPDERHRLLEWSTSAGAVVGALEEQVGSARSCCGHGATEGHVTLEELEAYQRILTARVGAITLQVRDACGMLDPDHEEVGHGTR